MTFKVKDKQTGEIFTVYAVNGSAFLIFDENFNEGTWLWEPMGKYIPA